MSKPRTQSGSSAITPIPPKPESDAGSDVSVGTEVSRAVKRLTTTTCVLNKVQGFFVSEKQYEKLQRKLDRAIAGVEPTSQDPATLLALNQKLNEVHESSAKLQAEIAAIAAEKKQVQDELQAAREKLKRQDIAGRTLSENSKFRIAELTQQLDAAKMTLNAASKNVIKAGKSSDPDGAVTAAQVKLEAQQSFDEAQNALQEAVRELDMSRSEELRARKNVNDLQALYDSAAGVLEGFRRQVKRASGEPIAAEELRVELRNPLLRATLGESALSWLSKELSLANFDVRQRAYTLMRASQTASNKVFVSLGDVLYLAYCAICRMSSTARMVLVDWLDELQADMLKLTLKTAGYYRQSLEKVMAKSPVLAEAVAKFKQEQTAASESARASRAKAKANRKERVRSRKTEAKWEEVDDLDPLTLKPTVMATHAYAAHKATETAARAKIALLRQRSKASGFLKKAKRKALSWYKTVARFCTRCWAVILPKIKWT